MIVVAGCDGRNVQQQIMTLDRRMQCRRANVEVGVPAEPGLGFSVVAANQKWRSVEPCA